MASGPSRASISSGVRSVQPVPIGPRSISRNASNSSTGNGGDQVSAADASAVPTARAPKRARFMGDDQIVPICAP
eukprot:scaffold103887_cov33-Phaeocystis_antarctica.AAC.2